MAHSLKTGNPTVTAVNSIAAVLGAPLNPDWTVEGLAEQLLGAIAAQAPGDALESLVDAEDSELDRQSRRLLRPLLACLATKSAAEFGTQPSLYGGSLAFQRSGSDGPVWVLGEFENRPGNLRLALRRSAVPPTSLEVCGMSPGHSNAPPELLDCLPDGG